MSWFWGRFGRTALLALILVPAAEGSHIRELPLPANDLVYDRFRERIYATVPSGTGGRGDTIAAIDPTSAKVVATVGVGRGAKKLALSDDGRYLYVALDGEGAVQRINLRARRVDQRFSLGKDRFGGAYRVLDIEVMPGRSETIAVARHGTGVLSHGSEIALFDNGVPRPRIVDSDEGWCSVEFGELPGRLYSLDAAGFRRLQAEPDGLTVVDAVRGLLIGGEIEFAGGRIYTTVGGVLDPEAGRLLGKFSWPFTLSGGVPDPVTERVFFLIPSLTPIIAFDARTFTPLGGLLMPEVQRVAGSPIRWGDDGFAFRTDSGQVFLVRTTMVAPTLPIADIAVRAMSKPPRIGVGGRATHTLTVTNHGPDAARSVELTYGGTGELKILAATSPRAKPVFRERSVFFDLGFLASGDSVSVTVRVTSRFGGARFNGAAAVSDTVDLNTENNSGGAGVDLVVSPGRDLSGFWEDVRGTCRGRACAITGTLYIHNQGREEAGPSRVRIYLSDDAVLDERDRLLKSVVAPRLVGGATTPVAVSAASRSLGAPGPKWLIAFVDVAGEVAESNEVNNVVTVGPIRLEVGR